MINGNLTFRDPSQNVLNGMRELAFRTALHAAAENSSLPNSRQTASFEGRVLHNVYKTDSAYMIGAAIVSLAGVFAVLPIYWDWWKLGRTMSLSPLEIARAFDAPLVRQAGSNMPSNRWHDDVGNRYVKYGELGAGPGSPAVVTPGAKPSLGFGDSTSVARPMARRRYQ